VSLDPLALLEEILRIASPSGGERALARNLARAMADLGFDAWLDGAGNAVGERGDGPMQIVLLGHMDTVPGEIAVRREGDDLYGRGAVDGKGPLAAFIAAAASVVVPDDRKLVVIGAVEEEAATSRGARHVIPHYAPAAVIIGEPSGWDHITIGYKGRLLIDYELSRPMAHTARGDPSVVEEAIGFWAWVKDLSEGYNAGRERQFDRLNASLHRINSSSDGLSDAVHMEMALRLPDGFDVLALKRRAYELARPAALEFSGYECAYRAEKNTPLVRTLLQAIRANGGAPRFSAKMGTSDMNVVGPAWGCPIVAYGPGDSDLDHTPNEHISIPEYLRSIAVLREALSHLLSEMAASALRI